MATQSPADVAQRLSMVDEGVHHVPPALYWRLRYHQAEVRAEQARLEVAMRAIEAANGLVDFSRYVYHWDDAACTLTRHGDKPDGD